MASDPKFTIPAYTGTPDVYAWSAEAKRLWSEVSLRSVMKAGKKKYQLSLEAILLALGGFGGAALEHAKAEKWFESAFWLDKVRDTCTKKVNGEPDWIEGDVANAEIFFGIFITTVETHFVNLYGTVEFEIIAGWKGKSRSDIYASALALKTRNPEDKSLHLHAWKTIVSMLEPEVQRHVSRYEQSIPKLVELLKAEDKAEMTRTTDKSIVLSTRPFEPIPITPGILPATIDPNNQATSSNLTSYNSRYSKPDYKATMNRGWRNRRNNYEERFSKEKNDRKPRQLTEGCYICGSKDHGWRNCVEFERDLRQGRIDRNKLRELTKKKYFASNTTVETGQEEDSPIIDDLLGSDVTTLTVGSDVTQVNDRLRLSSTGTAPGCWCSVSIEHPAPAPAPAKHRGFATLIGHRIKK